MNQNINLPTRKWYSMVQAIKQIKKLTNEELGVDDLLHFYIIGKLEFSVYFTSNLFLHSIGNLYFRINDDGLMNKDNFKINVICDHSENIELEDIFSFRKKSKSFSQNQHLSLTIQTESKLEQEADKQFISGFMRIYTNVDNDPTYEKTLKEKGIILNTFNYLLSPRELKDKEIIIPFHFESDEDLYLDIENLYILNSDLESFIYNKVEKEDINKIINKGGRPEIRYKDQLIELAKKISQAYPNHNRARISDAILELVNNKGYFTDQNFKITPETTLRILRENEIGKPRGESTPIRSLDKFK